MDHTLYESNDGSSNQDIKLSLLRSAEGPSYNMNCFAIETVKICSFVVTQIRSWMSIVGKRNIHFVTSFMQIF